MEANPIPDFYLGDLWFTSIYVVENISVLYIGILKSNSKRYSKIYLHETMKNWPSGVYSNIKHLMNVGNTKEQTVYAMGYKYGCSKVILFLFNEQAGHT